MYELIVIGIAVLEIAAAVAIFSLKDVMHSALFLALLFLVNSAAFLALEQPILAIIQLFIMVGGVATYLFVGVASEYPSKTRHTNIAALAIVSLLVFLSVWYPVSGYFSGTNVTSLSFSSISSELSSGYQLLYLIVALLFGVALGSILLLKSLSEKGGAHD